ncbi:MAG: NADH-quinone oxidoreductase subunit G [Aeromicrobium erythreum]
MTLEAQAGTEAPVELVTLTIDDVEVSVPKGTLVIRAAELIGTDIPRFCDHPLLDPVGACRQCLVEVTDAGNGRGMPKPQASCTIPVAPGMVVRTHLTSPVAEKAQHGTMELLLVNHPLDCPVCDKGGECPLQNQAMSHGRAESRFEETKRTFPKPYPVSEQVLLDRERCVLCARCTRFSEQIAGDPFIALVERGAQQQVGIGPGLTGDGEPFHSYFAGNTIQICPVGALTSADYRFRARPFDLVSTPSVAEHDACGSAIRVDHRRGKVMRRLAGDDPEVNEEWITDKDRFCFTWSQQPDRLRTPLVRDAETGELVPTSWPGALAVAARGLQAADGVGVLPGGRLTAEDAFAYGVFARAVLGTNDVDFRARAHSDEEAQFLASTVALHRDVTYADLERADRVVLAGLEPEDEAGAIFLRLRKGTRAGRVQVVTIASHLSRGSQKLGATLVPTVPGAEAQAIADLDLGPSDVLLVGERLATSPGALSAAAASGARLAWVPRRAGDRGAVEAGLLPDLLPGGRPVTSAQARADLAAALKVTGSSDAPWPTEPGRSVAAMLEAASVGGLGALVVGGVEVADLPDPDVARDALEKVFVVSLEVRASEVTERADVVLPVAATVEKPGSFVSWDGRVRPFEAVLDVPGALPDVRVLAGIAEELGRPLGFRTVAEAAARMREVGPWDGERTPAPTAAPGPDQRTAAGQVVVSTWRQLVDDGRGQDGQPAYRATGRRPVLRASAATLGDVTSHATISTEIGSATFPVVVDDLPDGVVWVPANDGVTLREIGVGHGSVVRLAPGEAPEAQVPEGDA